MQVVAMTYLEWTELDLIYYMLGYLNMVHLVIKMYL